MDGYSCSNVRQAKFKNKQSGLAELSRHWWIQNIFQDQKWFNHIVNSVGYNREETQLCDPHQTADFFFLKSTFRDTPVSLFSTNVTCKDSHWSVCTRLNIEKRPRVLQRPLSQRRSWRKLAFSLQAAYGESDSLQKKRDVFVPTFNRCSPGSPWVWEM